MGGAENLAVRIANGLASRGHRSHLVVTGGPDILAEKVAPDVHIHYLGYERKTIRRPLAFARSLVEGRSRLRYLVTRHELEVVQSHLPGANFLGLLLTWGGGVSVFPTVHNNREFDYGDLDSALLRSLRKRAYRMMVDRCAGLVAVSEAVKTSLGVELALDAERLRRIHVATNGVHVPDPLPPAEIRAVRDRFTLGPDDVLVLSAGRLAEQKNFVDLVRTAAQLDGSARLRFVVAGDGPLRGDLEQQIAASGLDSTITLVGNVTDLDRLMGAADIFLTTSLWEGLPLVMLEAMACGLPVVGYAIDGIDEIVSNDIHGHVVPVGDIAALAGALEGMAASTELRDRCGRASRELVRRAYSIDRLVTDLIAIYERCSRSS